jgi:hypothetical protein
MAPSSFLYSYSWRPFVFRTTALMNKNRHDRMATLRLSRNARPQLACVELPGHLPLLPRHVDQSGEQWLDARLSRQLVVHLLDLQQQLRGLRRPLLGERHDLTQPGYLGLAGTRRLSLGSHHHAVGVRNIDLLGVVRRRAA